MWLIILCVYYKIRDFSLYVANEPVSKENATIHCILGLWQTHIDAKRMYYQSKTSTSLIYGLAGLEDCASSLAS